MCNIATNLRYPEYCMDAPVTKADAAKLNADVPTEVVTPSQMMRLRAPSSDLSGERILATAPRVLFDGKSVPALGGVALLSKLGQGGMGAVYLGHEVQTNTPVAVKVLPLQMESESVAIGRFIREASLASKVKSEHLVGVTAVNQENGLYYFVMEYIDGRSAGAYMRDVREEGRQIDETTALEICIAATRGLAVAHEAGIIHRDIKPDNIMIPKMDSGELSFIHAKLADLGLARNIENDQSMTETQVALGTPGYMAPEQCKDAKKADKCADTFSMGACLYALLAGRPPFVANSAFETILATLTRPHQPISKHRPDVSAATGELIERCLTKEPRVRYENAAKLLDALLVCRDSVKQGRTMTIPGRAKPAFNHDTPAMQTVIKPHLPAKPATPIPVMAARSSASPPYRQKKSGNVLALLGGVALLALAGALTFGPWKRAQVEAPESAPIASAEPTIPPLPKINPVTPQGQTSQPNGDNVNDGGTLATPLVLEGEKPPVPEPARAPEIKPETVEEKQPTADELAAAEVREEFRKGRLAQAKANVAVTNRLLGEAKATAAELKKATAEAQAKSLELARAKEAERAAGQLAQDGRRKMDQMVAEMEKKPPPGGRRPPKPAQDPMNNMRKQMDEIQEKHRAAADKLRAADEAYRFAAEKESRAKWEAEKAEASAKSALKIALEAVKEFPELKLEQ
jgi:serine/threonine protein kinase